ncbi:hypothetical protein KEM60_01475 [Austwickia sp. TVS 96-490-7B]|uniref:choice-of-anchor M domain-containing protein n=1 Tax=Austwickia sp. TVS 96-490-7B TaxID=2830843 RepID=UPI001C57E107|nr:choice-of-anchor M domain-containing protein [Austwickia sp. TVS 96-490-7B]MBW3085278.1 hypothetical protein [Austwickia sp. TVS 96-490-7B]
MTSTTDPAPPAHPTRHWRLPALAAVVTLLVAASTTTAVAEDTDPSLRQRVDAAEKTVVGTPAVIDAGHVDLGPKKTDGTWQLNLRDDTVQPPVWRRPEDVVLRVKDQATLPAPGGDRYHFLGVDAGTPVHVVPQTQNSQTIWVGWNTQDPAVVAELSRGANLRLLGTSGPGALVLFLQDGAFGGARPLWDSRKPAPQDIWAETNTHVHANWVFTRPGAYAVTVQVRGHTHDGTARGAQATLRFAVGDAVKEDEVRALAAPRTDPAHAALTPTAGESGASGTGRTDNPPSAGVWPVIGGVGVLAALAAVGGVLTWRRRRTLREQAQAATTDTGADSASTSSAESPVHEVTDRGGR